MIVMWILSCWVVYVYCICICMQAWIYVSSRINLFTRILLMWFQQSWCKYSHGSTCLGVCLFVCWNKTRKTTLRLLCHIRKIHLLNSNFLLITKVISVVYHISIFVTIFVLFKIVIWGEILSLLWF